MKHRAIECRTFGSLDEIFALKFFSSPLARLFIERHENEIIIWRVRVIAHFFPLRILTERIGSWPIAHIDERLLARLLVLQNSGEQDVEWKSNKPWPIIVGKFNLIRNECDEFLYSLAHRDVSFFEKPGARKQKSRPSIRRLMKSERIFSGYCSAHR